MTDKKELSREEHARYNRAIGEIRTLLELWLEAGIDLFLTMRKIEKQGDWKLPGHATFNDFLRKEFRNALGFEKYNNVIQAIELYGENFVRTIGVEPCHTISISAMAESPENREELVSSVKEHIDLHGSPPDRNKMRNIVLGIAKLAKEPSIETELVRLRAEVKKLRAECARLKEHVVDLEAERERLLLKKDQNNKKKGTARKPGRKVSKSLHP